MLRILRNCAVLICAAVGGVLILGTANELFGLGIWQEHEYPVLIDQGFNEYFDFASQYVAGLIVMGTVAIFLVQLVAARE